MRPRPTAQKEELDGECNREQPALMRAGIEPEPQHDAVDEGVDG